MKQKFFDWVDQKAIEHRINLKMHEQYEKKLEVANGEYRRVRGDCYTINQEELSKCDKKKTKVEMGSCLKDLHQQTKNCYENAKKIYDKELEEINTWKKNL